jgi:ankyrin repeat protein
MGGNTPLWFAAQGDREGREEMVRLLLKHGAAVNFAGEYGWTALHMSAQWNHPEIARVLVEHGAEASCRDEEGRTPLDIAEKHGSEAARSYLATVA